MTQIDSIQKNLIQKILRIRKRAYLENIEGLISSQEEKKVKLTPAQKEMLQMSERDIEEGKLISQEAMIKRNREWLNGK